MQQQQQQYHEQQQSNMHARQQAAKAPEADKGDYIEFEEIKG